MSSQKVEIVDNDWQRRAKQLGSVSKRWNRGYWELVAGLNDGEERLMGELAAKCTDTLSPPPMIHVHNNIIAKNVAQ